MTYTSREPIDERVPPPLAYGLSGTVDRYTLVCLICRMRVNVTQAEYEQTIESELYACICDDECQSEADLAELMGDKKHTF